MHPTWSTTGRWDLKVTKKPSQILDVCRCIFTSQSVPIDLIEKLQNPRLQRCWLNWTSIPLHRTKCYRYRYNAIIITSKLHKKRALVPQHLFNMALLPPSVFEYRAMSLLVCLTVPKVKQPASLDHILANDSIPSAGSALVSLEWENYCSNETQKGLASFKERRNPVLWILSKLLKNVDLGGSLTFLTKDTL